MPSPRRRCAGATKRVPSEPSRCEKQWATRRGGVVVVNRAVEEGRRERRYAGGCATSEVERTWTGKGKKGGGRR